MITSIRCENFRCFKDTGILHLAPLTILVGENNSGKSAILHALNLPALTLQSGDERTPLSLLTRDYDYGSFSDVVFGHRQLDKITFSYGIQTDYKKYEKATVRIKLAYQPKRKEIYLDSFVIENGSSKLLEISQNKYSGSIKNLEFFGDKDNSGIYANLLKRENFYWYPKLDPFETLRKLLRKFPEKDKSKDVLDKMGQIFYLVQNLKDSLLHTYHLGPLRDPARRTLQYSGSSYMEKIGTRGEDFLQSYSALIKRGKKVDRAHASQVKDALYKLGFVKRIDLVSVGAKHFEFWTEHNISHLSANLADTGFGASQVLPVLFLLFIPTDCSMLLFEQPELHLHPAAQAELGSIFAQAVSPRKRILIETHSENLILRIQTEVAVGRLKPSDVIFYYILPQDNGHKVVSIRLNEKGEFLDEWPKGFFEENYLESLKLSRARLK